MRWLTALGMPAAAVVFAASCGRAQSSRGDPAAPDTGIVRSAAGSVANDLPSDVGHDAHDIPHYTTRAFTSEERTLLKDVYGIDDPSRLYVSDSTDEGLLKYDTQRKACRTCYVNSYRIGFISIRRPGESWSELERRVKSMPASAFPAAALTESASTADLDPAIRDDVEHMLADAARVGFRLRVAATYRSPEREAYLFGRGGRTHTLTSLHSYGRAIDIVVGDGNLKRRRTRASWIAFRRWVTTYHDREFRVLGTAENTWDWPHVEVPSADVGFPSIDAAIDRARRCRTTKALPCDFAPHLPTPR